MVKAEGKRIWPAVTLMGLLVILALVVASCGNPPGIAQPQAGQETQADQGSDAQAGSQEPAAAGDNAQVAPIAGPPSPGDDVRSKGSPDAPVTIVEYSDYQCPFCSRWFQQTYPTLVQEYIDTGKVRLEFRDFPLSMHPNAPEAAVAARCAGEQNAYWDMHDKLFSDQNDWAGLADPTETFVGYATELGLDAGTFSQCLSGGKFDEAIQQDMLAGQQAGVTGTPSFLINGNLLVGAQPTDVFRQAIDTVLSGGTLNTGQPAAQATQEPPEPVDIPIAGAPVKGDPNAPMTIVEYTDFQCPYCERFYTQTLGPLLEQYVDTGQAKLVFKDFPLTSIHPQAQKAAEAARCVRQMAGSDEAFWQMHDMLFGGQQDWSGNSSAGDVFAGYAEEIGVDPAAFSACLDSGEQADTVAADFQEGVNLGVQGTPTFFINGQSFVGAQPIANFQQAIAVVNQGGSIAPPPQPTAAPTPTPAPLTQDIPLDDAAGVQGDPNAPVTIVEYTDYQCPFCERHFTQTLPQLQEYIDQGTVRYAVKDFPLTSIHPQAAKAAEAARCAAEQDAFWEMHDQLFQTQQQWSGQATAVDTFKTLAGQLGLDQAAFDTCIDTDKYAAIIDANQQEGIGYGVRGTPGFFVNRTNLPGAYPFSVFQQLIEAEANQ